MDDRELLAKNLKSIMKLKGIKRKDLSLALNIKYSTLCEWLKGARYPRIEALRCVANYLEVPLGDLVSEHSILEYKLKYLKLLKKIEELSSKKNNLIKINDVEYIKLQSIEKLL